MYKQLIVAAVLLVFVCAKLDKSHDCWQCHSAQTCKFPTKVTCDQKAANNTRKELKKYFARAPRKLGANFSCLHMTYNKYERKFRKPQQDLLDFLINRKNYFYNYLVHVVEIRGCVDRELHACDLNLKSVGSFKRWSKQNCTLCNDMLCNRGVSMNSNNMFTLWNFEFIDKKKN